MVSDYAIIRSNTVLYGYKLACDSMLGCGDHFNVDSTNFTSVRRTSRRFDELHVDSTNFTSIRRKSHRFSVDTLLIQSHYFLFAGQMMVVALSSPVRSSTAPAPPLPPGLTRRKQRLFNPPSVPPSPFLPPALRFARLQAITYGAFLRCHLSCNYS